MRKMPRQRQYSNKFFRLVFRLAGPVISFFRPFKVIGRENMREGATMVCSNHSAMIDPFLIGIAYGIDSPIHVFAKIELFRIPFVSGFLWKMGMICVDRSINDIASIKTSLNYLKNGEKVVIFPEGTRATEHDAVTAKSGAIKLAERAGAPIQPVFLPRKKPFFRMSKLVFGELYYIEKQDKKRTANDYTKLAEELMQKIQALDPAGS